MNSFTKALAVGGVIAALGATGWQALAATPGPMGGGHGPAGVAGNPGDGFGTAALGNPATALERWKSALDIQPNQQAAWDQYAAAVTESAATFTTMRGAMGPGMMANPTAMQALATAHLNTFTKLRTAAVTLVGDLNATQAARATALGLPGLSGGGMMQAGMMGGGMMGAGMMGAGQPAHAAHHGT